MPGIDGGRFYAFLSRLKFDNDAKVPYVFCNFNLMFFSFKIEFMSTVPYLSHQLFNCYHCFCVSVYTIHVV